jgi:cytochrome c oxidase subunit 2
MVKPAVVAIRAAAIIACVAAAAYGASGEDVIQVTAQRYSYSPSEIVLHKGRPAVLEITSRDFMHGFKVPALNIRVDLPPDTVTRVRVTPEKAGTYDFLCDNFCGAGHEQMEGRIVVKE